jgi:hypothetical protein
MCVARHAYSLWTRMANQTSERHRRWPAGCCPSLCLTGLQVLLRGPLRTGWVQCICIVWKTVRRCIKFTACTAGGAPAVVYAKTPQQTNGVALIGAGSNNV